MRIPEKNNKIKRSCCRAKNCKRVANVAFELGQALANALICFTIHTLLCRSGFLTTCKFYDGLRNNASIEWKDEAFRLMYEASLNEERRRAAIAVPTGPETPATDAGGGSRRWDNSPDSGRVPTVF